MDTLEQLVEQANDGAKAIVNLYRNPTIEVRVGDEWENFQDYGFPPGPDLDSLLGNFKTPFEFRIREKIFKSFSTSL